MKPITVRFVGVIDAVSSGGAQMWFLEKDVVTSNVKRAHYAKRDKDYNFADKTIFKHLNITAESANTLFTQSLHSTSHAASGFPSAKNPGLEKSLRNAAVAAGVPLPP